MGPNTPNSYTISSEDGKGSNTPALGAGYSAGGVLCLDGWAGREEYPVEIIGETGSRYRVRLLMEVMLPGARQVHYGDIVLVPKYSIRKEQS